MFFLALLDVFLAGLMLGAPGLTCPVADAYSPCSTPVTCTCPDDSPCKKDCCKDACTCKQTVAQAACTQAVAPLSCTMPACPVAYPAPAVPAPAVPAMAPVTMVRHLYQVQLKVSNHTRPTMVLPAGQMGTMMVCSADEEGSCCGCQLNLHLADNNDGRVKVFVMATVTSRGCGGYPNVAVYQGKKKVALDKTSNVVLAGDGAEPLSAEVLVKAVGAEGVMAFPVPSPYAPPMPAPVPVAVQVPVLPMTPPPAAPMACLPPPMPSGAPNAGPPEPMPLPMPTTPPVAPCVALAPAKASEASAHVELVRCCEKSRLVVKGDGDGCVKSVRMTIDKGECGALTVAAGKKYVHVHGKKWKAYADKVEIMADGHVKLTGNVRLLSEWKGTSQSVKAESLCVHVKDGKLGGIVGH